MKTLTEKCSGGAYFFDAVYISTNNGKGDYMQYCHNRYTFDIGLQKIVKLDCTFVCGAFLQTRQ